MKYSLAHFWYRFKNWFRTKPGPGEPLRFLCGSDEELRRVTTWACHVLPDAFAESTHHWLAKQNEIVFCYTSPCKSWQWEEAQCKIACAEGMRDYLWQWGKLVLKYNLFTGTQWTPHCQKEVQTTWRDIIAPSGFSLWLFVEEPFLFIVRVHPPSAHERAEALLALSEWLDGKVSDEEKCELLQLPDDVEVCSAAPIRRDADVCTDRTDVGMKRRMWKHG